MKEYFSHDYNTREDQKIKKLIAKHGLLGYGIFWALIEVLYQNANALRLDYEVIAFDLRQDVDTIKSIVNDFGLFGIDGDIMSSLSVQRRLNEREYKSLKARESAFERWNKEKQNANALRTQSDSNAIKEKKRKENKSKEDKENEFSAKASNLNQTEKTLSETELKKFVDYWTESSGTKMRFEKEKTFDIGRRLKRWAENTNKFAKPEQPQKPQREQKLNFIELTPEEAKMWRDAK